MSEPTDTTVVSDDDLQERLLDWLGLPADASLTEVETTHHRLMEFLDSAPLTLQPWARQQVTAATAARRVLLAPEGQDPSGSAASTPAAAVPAPPVTAGNPNRNNPMMAVLLVLLVIAVVVGVYFMGDRGEAGQTAGSSPTPSSAPQVGAAAPVPVDQKKADDLAAKVEADPDDTTSMRELANMYFEAADFANAATWQANLIEVNPDDTDARLALGAAKFNAGDAAEAEKQWREVLRIDPRNAEAHYDLGFLYLGKNPPDIEKAEAEWAKVSELAPGSEIATTAQAHLDRLGQMAPTTPVAPAPTATR